MAVQISEVPFPPGMTGGASPGEPGAKVSGRPIRSEPYFSYIF